MGKQPVYETYRTLHHEVGLHGYPKDSLVQDEIWAFRCMRLYKAVLWHALDNGTKDALDHAIMQSKDLGESLRIVHQILDERRDNLKKHWEQKHPTTGIDQSSLK